MLGFGDQATPSNRPCKGRGETTFGDFVTFHRELYRLKIDFRPQGCDTSSIHLRLSLDYLCCSW